MADTTTLREILEELGLGDGATLASLQRRLGINAATGMRLFALREAIKVAQVGAADEAEGVASTPQIQCPACGDVVQQVSSATLGLALFQHYRWVCRKGFVGAVAPPPEAARP